jgi:hypothetical protein
LKTQQEGSDVNLGVTIGEVNADLTVESNIVYDSSDANSLTYWVSKGYNTDSIPDLTAKYTTINYDALNLWWQMENLPSFLKGW